MNPKQRSNLLTGFSLLLLLVLILLFFVYNYDSGFGAGDTGASQEVGDGLSYVGQLGDFERLGGTYGVDLYGAQSVASSSGSEVLALRSVSISVENAPLGSHMEFCVMRRAESTSVESRLFCLGRNIEVASDLSFEQTFPFDISMARGDEYFCSYTLADLSQGEDLAGFPAASCELGIITAQSSDNLVRPLDWSFLANWGLLDRESLIEYSYDQEDLVASNLVYGSDASLPAQKISQAYSYSRGVESSYSPIAPNALDCDPEPGRVGLCYRIDYLKAGSDYELVGDLESHCRQVVELGADTQLVGVAAFNRFQRCLAILSSNTY